MEEMFIGDYIRKHRKALKLTQLKLSEGICDPVTISRIERGTQMPNRDLLNALFERLGLPSDRIFVALSEQELKISELQNKIITCNIARDTKKGLKYIDELRKIINENEDVINRQFILYSRVVLGTQEGAYRFNEKLKMVMEAIRMTVPAFDINNICEGLYSINEIKIINLIGLIYSDNGQHEKAADIFSQLLNYIKKHFKEKVQSGGYLTMVMYNYSRELGLCGKYEESIRVANEAWGYCIEYDYYQQVPGLIAVMAECNFYLGNIEKSKDLYNQAYYTYRSKKDYRNASIIKKEAYNHLKIIFKF